MWKSHSVKRKRLENKVWTMSDILVVLPPLTADDCVIFAKNADRPPTEVQEVVYFPPQDHPNGTKLQVGEIEPTHEIMALIALRKLNLQTRMRSNPLGLHVWFLVRPVVYFHTLCMRTAKAMAGLCRCAVSPETSLFAYAGSTIISWAGSIMSEGMFYDCLHRRMILVVWWIISAMLNLNIHTSYFSHAVNYSHELRHILVCVKYTYDQFWDFNRYEFFTNV